MKKLSFVILILAGMAIWGSQATAHSMIYAHFTSAGLAPHKTRTRAPIL